MTELSRLPNIGKVVEAQLNEVGISTEADLKAVGSKQAWLRILAIDDSTCINRLMALEGAVRGVKKSTLSDEVKTELKKFYREHKG